MEIFSWGYFFLWGFPVGTSWPLLDSIGPYWLRNRLLQCPVLLALGSLTAQGPRCSVRLPPPSPAPQGLVRGQRRGRDTRPSLRRARTQLSTAPFSLTLRNALSPPTVSFGLERLPPPGLCQPTAEPGPVRAGCLRSASGLNPHEGN